jgi:hypothetical protein
MNFRITLTCSIVIFSTACREHNSKNTLQIEADKPAVSIPANHTGIGLEPQLKSAENLQIIYYDDPDGDSLRYTRYFRYTSVSDSAMVNRILKNLDMSFDERESVNRQCRSEGKIILYKGEEPIKTLYFSMRCNSACCYLYFIKNGMFYYFPLQEATARLLEEGKKKSVAP